MEKLIAIIHDVLNNIDNKYEIDSKTYNLANFHRLTSYLYPLINKDNTNKEIIDNITKRYLLEVKKDTMQILELDKIIKLFESNDIDFIPLKGSVLKNIYISSVYRSMGDIDILVKKKDYKKAIKLIRSIGYNKPSYTIHHATLSKEPFYEVEIHKSLLGLNKYGENIFNNIFDICHLKDNYKHYYEMSNEDFYLFMMCHLLKHYNLAGTGIRSFIDVYLYLNTYKDLDFNYINDKLKTYPFYETSNMIKEFSLKVFDDISLNEKETLLLDRILKSGVYGNIEFMSENELKESNNKVSKIILAKLFPSVNTLKKMYICLDKAIILLPICYISYLFKLLTRFPYLLKRYKMLKKVSKRNKENGR